jgi:hypothetical protein
MGLPFELRSAKAVGTDQITIYATQQPVNWCSGFGNSVENI